MLLAIITHRSVAGLVISFLTLFVARTSVAQSGYVHDQPAMQAYPVSFGAGYYHASTAAEGFLRGRAAVIESLGNYEVSDSQAGLLREQGRALNRENNLKQTEALHSQKKMWSDALYQARKESEARAAEGRRLIAEKQATVYRNAYQLSAHELNLKTGAISWPVALQDARFQENRDRLEELFRQHVGYGASNAGSAQEIARSVDQWARVLRNDVGSMPREDYLAAQKFLLGLKYGAASLVGTRMATAT